MSNPNNPGDPFNPDGGLPRYEPTNHPEDQPSFGQQGAGGYAGYQAAGGPQKAPTGTFGGRPKAQVSWSEAMTYGFKAPFANPKVWILGSVLCTLGFFIFMGLSAALASSDNTAIFSPLLEIVFSIATVILTPFVMRLALHEVDKGKATWSDFTVDVHPVPAIVVSILVSFITAMITLILMIPAFVPLFTGLSALSDEGGDVDPAVLLGIMAPFFGFMALAIFASIFITPLLQFTVWYAASGQAGIGSAITAGFRLGRTNYVQILIYLFLMGIISSFIAMFTLGLGLIIVLPVSYLAQAHLFRQMAGNMPVRNA